MKRGLGAFTGSDRPHQLASPSPLPAISPSEGLVEETGKEALHWAVTGLAGYGQGLPAGGRLRWTLGPGPDSQQIGGFLPEGTLRPLEEGLYGRSPAGVQPGNLAQRAPDGHLAARLELPCAPRANASGQQASAHSGNPFKKDRPTQTGKEPGHISWRRQGRKHTEVFRKTVTQREKEGRGSVGEDHSAVTRDTWRRRLGTLK